MGHTVWQKTILWVFLRVCVPLVKWIWKSQPLTSFLCLGTKSGQAEHLFPSMVLYSHLLMEACYFLRSPASQPQATCKPCPLSIGTGSRGFTTVNHSTSKIFRSIIVCVPRVINNSLVYRLGGFLFFPIIYFALTIKEKNNYHSKHFFFPGFPFLSCFSPKRGVILIKEKKSHVLW